MTAQVACLPGRFSVTVTVNVSTEPKGQSFSRTERVKPMVMSSRVN